MEALSCRRMLSHDHATWTKHHLMMVRPSTDTPRHHYLDTGIREMPSGCVSSPWPSGMSSLLNPNCEVLFRRAVLAILSPSSTLGRGIGGTKSLLERPVLSSREAIFGLEALLSRLLHVEPWSRSRMLLRRSLRVLARDRRRLPSSD